MGSEVGVVDDGGVGVGGGGFKGVGAKVYYADHPEFGELGSWS